MEKLLLIDGNSLVFRAYHATAYGRLMTTSNGIPTNALFGFAQMVQKAITDFAPDEVLVAFDTGKKTFRHQIYPEYKGTRKKPDEELIVQFPIVREYLDAMNITRYEQDGIEADDVIGSLVNKYANKDIAILTGDRDLLQLINDHTTVWLMKTGLSEMKRMDLKALKEDYGLTPSQVIDYKGLCGDASDNIPGVPSVGDKTAMKLLDQYGDLENTLANVEQIKGSVGNKIREFSNQALLSKQLATIKTDEEIDLDENNLDYHQDKAKQFAFYKKYELNKFINQLDYQPGEVEKTYQTTLNLNKFKADQFKQPTALFAVYDSTIHSLGNLRGFGLTNEQGSWFYSADLAIKDEEFLTWLKGDTLKIVYDVKDLYHLLVNNGIPGINKVFDLMIAAFLVNDTITDYKRLSEEYGFIPKVSFSELYGRNQKTKTLIDLEQEIVYVGENSQFIYSLQPKLQQKLEEMEMAKLYNEVELPLALILFKMENTGIRVDQQALNSLAKMAKEKVDTLSNEISNLAGGEFNINSPKQLGEVLYDKLNLPGGKKRSTAIDVLEKLRPAHEIIGKIIDYRKYQKFYSTYAEGLKKYIHSDGKIHTNYNQCVVSTGRLSSTEPNLQNISVRDEENKEIRKAFIAEKDCVIMSADYSQVELRVLASMAGEPALIETFKENIDVHTRTAMDVFKVKKEDVTDSMRRKAKMVNFGIVYGISDFGLAERLDIDRYEAQSYINSYFESYPLVKKYMDDTVKYCEQHGYVKTLLNRRREIPEINDKEYMKREFGKRAAMNAPIQGTAADLIKLAMIKIDKKLTELHLDSKMILQVHDELIFNVPENEIETMKEVIEQGMEHAMELKAPLEAKCVYGHTWYEAE